MSEATGKERGKRGPRQVREGRWEDEDADEDEDESNDGDGEGEDGEECGVDDEREGVSSWILTSRQSHGLSSR